jgi:cell division protein FtsB
MTKPLARRVFIGLVAVCVTVCLGGCGYEAVESQELVRLKVAEAENTRLKQENARLKEQVTNLKSVGRFQIHQNGFRTWRLDTATGQDCLLLASQTDWKKAETSLQACPAQ